MVQQAILAVLPYLGVFAFPIDAGAKALRGRAFGALRAANLGTSALAGRTGAAEKGVSDIIGVRKDGRAVFIEVKKPALLDIYGKVLEPPGKPSKAQLDFLLTGHLHNAIVGVAWSTSDVDFILGDSRGM
jgi:hypothetical protein